MAASCENLLKEEIDVDDLSSLLYKKKIAASELKVRGKNRCECVWGGMFCEERD